MATYVPDLAAALHVVRGAAQPNGGGILVDALHFDRSLSRLEDLAMVPRAWLHYWQSCDAPAERPSTTEGLLHTARAARRIAWLGRRSTGDAAAPALLLGSHRPSAINFLRWDFQADG